MEKETIRKGLIYFIILWLAILSMYLFPRMFKSLGQGDGLPEIISALTFLYIGPGLILFSLLGFFYLYNKNKYTFTGGVIGIIIGVMLILIPFGKMILIPIYYASSIILGLWSMIFNYKCSGECGEFFIFTYWISILILTFIGMGIGYTYGKSKKKR